MPVDALTKPLTQENSLNRPSPMNKMQQNTAELFEKTSHFVKDQFNELHNLDEPESASRFLAASLLDLQDSPSRLNPQGMGRLIDIYV